MSSGLEVPGLLFADDLVLLANSPADLQLSLSGVSQWANFNEMSFGINKCGIMRFPGADPLESHWTWSLQSQTIPIVTQYTYLGIEITPSLELLTWTRNKVKKADRMRLAIRPVLASKTIPLNLRVLFVRALIESRLRYGCELVGFSLAQCRPLQLALNQALLDVVGTIGSGNTVFARLVLWLELDIPPISTSASVAMIRAYRKYQSLPSIVSDVLKAPSLRGQRPWGSSVRRWAASHKVDLDLPYLTKQEKLSIGDTLIGRYKRQNPTKALTYYLNSDLIQTKRFITKGTLYPQLAVGLTWLVRIRCSAVWTGARAASLGLIPPFFRHQCVCCGLTLTDSLNSEIQHLLVDCSQFYSIRQSSGLADLIHRVRQQFGLLLGLSLQNMLLGGATNSSLTLGTFWLNLHNGNPGCQPDFVSVATVLQLVMPVYMDFIWKHRRTSTKAWNLPQDGMGETPQDSLKRLIPSLMTRHQNQPILHVETLFENPANYFFPIRSRTHPALRNHRSVLELKKGAISN
ncbi:hypothetical protein BDC45DRAFT_607981 [Circinella umbellata]|nr:hypothetical protein BDC45DRAFT_607981 [Circinella umbellata]